MSNLPKLPKILRNVSFSDSILQIRKSRYKKKKLSTVTKVDTGVVDTSASTVLAILLRCSVLLSANLLLHGAQRANLVTRPNQATSPPTCDLYTP